MRCLNFSCVISKHRFDSILRNICKEITKTTSISLQLSQNDGMAGFSHLFSNNSSNSLETTLGNDERLFNGKQYLLRRDCSLNYSGLSAISYLQGFQSFRICS